MSEVAGRPSLRVKMMTRAKPGQDGLGWTRYFPASAEGLLRWGDCTFTFDRNARDYDWLVVYDDLPSVSGERHTLWEEELACARANTMLITYEPSTIKVYGSRFLRQFGWVLTSQEAWVIDHPGTIRRQPGFVWFYAPHSARGDIDALRARVPLAKTGEVSAICSTKQQKNTLHRRRYEFVMELKKQLPAMELYGRGIRFVEEKADALDPYRYHVAIENFYGPHHWTEKLADPFLGACMPIYYGCPNAEDYFPPESFLRIDLADANAAAEAIRHAITDRLYEKNLPAILESRRRILDDYGPIAQISRLVQERHAEAALRLPGQTIASRHRLRRRSWFNGVGFLAEKMYVTTRHRLAPANSSS